MGDGSAVNQDHHQPDDLQSFQEAVEKAKDAVRDLAKWIVGGIALATGGVIGGASLTSMGSLDWGWRLQLAAGAAAAGIGLLGYLMWVALEVMTPRSYSMKDIANGKDIRPHRLKIIEPRVRDLFPDGIKTVREFTERGMRLGREARQASASPEVKRKAELYRRKVPEIETSLTYEHVLLLFWELKVRVIVVTPLIAISFGIFAWAANPPREPAKSAFNDAAAPDVAGAAGAFLVDIDAFRRTGSPRYRKIAA